MATSTLTWFNSGLGAVASAVTNAGLINDMVTLFNSKLADANFSWQVASSNSAGNPFYVVLKRKNGTPGRILFVIWTTAVTNPVIAETTPTINQIYPCYFPNGNIDTPTNLTASSGSIMGDDTGTTKLGAGVGVTTPMWKSSSQMFYFDCADGIIFGINDNPTAAGGTYPFILGMLAVDTSDNAYAIASSFGGNEGNNLFSSSSSCPWQAGTVLPGGIGSSNSCFRLFIGGVTKAYFMAYLAGAWGTTAAANDVKLDAANSKAFFYPIQLLSQTKGEGLLIKLRQMAMGPATSGAFALYNTTGPVAAARAATGNTTGATGPIWATNFKI